MRHFQETKLRKWVIYELWVCSQCSWPSVSQHAKIFLNNAAEQVRGKQKRSSSSHKDPIKSLTCFLSSSPITDHPERAALFFVCGVCLGLFLTLFALVIQISCRTDCQPRQRPPAKKRARPADSSSDSSDSDSDWDTTSDLSARRHRRFERTLNMNVFTSAEELERAQRLEERERIIREIWMNGQPDIPGTRSLNRYYWEASSLETAYLTWTKIRTHLGCKRARDVTLTKLYKQACKSDSLTLMRTVEGIADFIADLGRKSSLSVGLYVPLGIISCTPFSKRISSPLCVVSSPLSAGNEGWKATLPCPWPQQACFEVGIYGFAALDTRRPVESTWWLKGRGLRTWGSCEKRLRRLGLYARHPPVFKCGLHRGAA